MQKLRQWFVLSFLLLIFLASSWSLLVTPDFFRVHDFTHAGRIAEMSRALQDGHFPVRWTSNFGYGYGMPLFEFYGPLPFYVGSLVFILFGNVIWSIKFLYLLSNLGTMIGSYLLGKKMFGKSGGLLLSAFLTLAPYRAMNLFARGALNEVWGIMFLPWILFGLIKIFHQEKGGWQTFFLSLVGLFLSHNITTMIFFPVLALFALAYLIWMFWQKSPEFFRKGRFRGLNFLRIMWQLIASGLLAISASAFYLIPAFLEKGYTHVEKVILTPYFDYHLHFLYIRQFFNPKWGYGGSSWGVDDGISFFLGWGQFLALLSLIVIWGVTLFKKFFKKDKTITPKIFYFTFTFGIIFVLSTLMSLLKTQSIWESIEIFKFIQFPWRWLAISIVFFAMLLASKAWLIKNRIVRAWCVGICVVVTAFSSAYFFQPEKYLENSDDFYYTNPSRIRKDLSEILHDYISVDMAEKPSRIVEGLVMSDHQDREVEILADRVHEKLIKTNFSEPTALELSMANYPGWRAEIDGQWWSKDRGNEGNILLEIPSGEHLVSLRFEGTAVRNWSDTVSLLSWLLFIYMIFPQKQTSKKIKVKND